MKRYVAVAGTIGAGKTSLVAWLVKRYGLVPFFEPNEQNPYLADFYGDMGRWAFHSQCFFLAHKLKLHQELAACERPAVIDRTIYEDAEIFAKNLHAQGFLSKRDWTVYRELYAGHLPEPAAAGRAHRAHVPARDGEEAHRPAGARDGGCHPGRVPAAAAPPLRGVVRVVHAVARSCASTRGRSTTSRTSWTSSR